jgi:MYXO-CTERM domain-containing protein
MRSGCRTATHVGDSRDARARIEDVALRIRVQNVASLPTPMTWVGSPAGPRPARNARGSAGGTILEAAVRVATRSRLTVALAALAIALAGPPQLANACSFVPGLYERRALPPPEAAGVPTNTRAVVSYLAMGSMSDPWVGGLGDDLEMRSKDGAAVPVTTEKFAVGADWGRWDVMVVLTPTEPLAPHTQYELLDRRGVLSCSRPCTPGEPTVFASFTTGMGRDDLPPRTSGRGRLLAGNIETCDSSACCGHYRIRPYEAEWPAAADDVAASLLYNLYRAGQPTPVMMVLLPATRVGFAVSCDSDRSAQGRLLMEPGSYSVRPVDWSGNEGPAVDLGTIPTSCDPADPSLSAPTEPAGCDCEVGAASQQTSPPAALLAFVLTFAGFYRRRRP